jgi:hypothetical protein
MAKKFVESPITPPTITLVPSENVTFNWIAAAVTIVELPFDPGHPLYFWGQIVSNFTPLKVIEELRK